MRRDGSCLEEPSAAGHGAAIAAERSFGGPSDRFLLQLWICSGCHVPPSEQVSAVVLVGTVVFEGGAEPPPPCSSLRGFIQSLPSGASGVSDNSIPARRPRGGWGGERVLTSVFLFPPPADQRRAFAAGAHQPGAVERFWLR